MHGLSTGALDGIQECIDTQVALPGRRGAEPDCHVGLANMTCVGIGVAEHRDRTDPHGLQRADDAHRDLAAVGDQDRIEGLRRIHGLCHLRITS